jgi:hypothetical protein
VKLGIAVAVSILLSIGVAGQGSAKPWQPISNTTLEELGYKRPVYRVYAGKRRQLSGSFSYRLPGDAFQGPDPWYVLDLRYRIRFDKRSGAGVVYVLGVTDDAAATQTRFNVTRPAGRLHIRASSFDLIDGWRERQHHRPVFEGRSRNYLQIEGVAPGRNTLSVEVETYGKARVRSVEVLNTSAIVLTHRTPPNQGLPTVRVAVDPIRGSIHEGESFVVGVNLQNMARTALHNVTARLTPEGYGLTGVNPAAVTFPVLRRRARSRFEIRARRHGRWRLVLSIGSGVEERTGALVPVAVLGDEHGAGLDDWVLRILVVVAAMTLFSLGARSVRKHV